MDADLSPRERVWQVVAGIPPGHVAGYGDVAVLAGLPRRARFVGKVLRELPRGTRLPWHRVLASDGRIALPADSASARTQRRRLEAEGVVFTGARVPSSHFAWCRDADQPAASSRRCRTTRSESRTAGTPSRPAARKNSA